MSNYQYADLVQTITNTELWHNGDLFKVIEGDGDGVVSLKGHVLAWKIDNNGHVATGSVYEIPWDHLSLASGDALMLKVEKEMAPLRKMIENYEYQLKTLETKKTLYKTIGNSKQDDSINLFKKELMSDA